ncbi:hypothetical protein ABQF33_24630 [Mycolicibacterium sp. XJ2]
MKAIHRFCITHEKPLLPDSWYDDCIAMGDFQTESPFHVKKLDSFWHEARPVAYGAAGSNAMPAAIRLLPADIEYIEVSSHRKRILPSPEGKESPVYPTMREVHYSDIHPKEKLAVFTPPHGFLVAQPLYLKESIIGNYTICHHRRDIKDYTSLAIEVGVLDTKSAKEFLASKHFIPGGTELGIFPRSWTADVMPKIERISRLFLTLYRGRVENYSSYQVRAVGFLSERLGSFLLFRHLKEVYSNKIPADVFGYMTSIVETGSSYAEAKPDRLRHSSTGSNSAPHRAG